MQKRNTHFDPNNSYKNKPVKISFYITWNQKSSKLNDEQIIFIVITLILQIVTLIDLYYLYFEYFYI